MEGKCLLSIWLTTFTIALLTKPWQMLHMGTPASFRLTYWLKSSGFEKGPKSTQSTHLKYLFQIRLESKIGYGSFMHALNMSCQSSSCTQNMVTLLTLVHEGVGEMFALDVAHHFWL